TPPRMHGGRSANMTRDPGGGIVGGRKVWPEKAGQPFVCRRTSTTAMAFAGRSRWPSTYWRISLDDVGVRHGPTAATTADLTSFFPTAGCGVCVRSDPKTVVSSF